jgi:hypothetical protein
MVTKWVTGKTDGELPNEQGKGKLGVGDDVFGNSWRQDIDLGLFLNLGQNDLSFARSELTFRLLKQAFSEGQPLPRKQFAKILTDCRTITVHLANVCDRRA